MTATDRLFVVLFKDKPDGLPIRQREMDNHLKFLTQHEACILAAGSMREEPNDKPIGALWIVKAPDRATVESLYKIDPFWTSGLRQSVKIRHWSKAFDRERLI